MKIQPQSIICTLVAIVLTPFLWMIVFPGNGEYRLKSISAVH